MNLEVISKKFKSIARSSLYGIGFFDLMRLLQRQRVTILMYHRFSEKSEPFKLSQKIFSQQLHYLSRKYSLIRLTDYVLMLYGERSNLPPNPLIITFDDGYQDNYEYAYPVLKKYNAPATIFLTTDFISRKVWLWSNRLEYILKNTSMVHFSFPIEGIDQTFHIDTFTGWHYAQLTLFNYCCTLVDTKKNEMLVNLAEYLKVIVPEKTTHEFAPLTWEQIREMQNAGVDYGSHTCSHPIMAQLSNREVVQELKDSKSEIENNIGEQVEVFCYPNGKLSDISGTVIDEVNHNGYRAAVTTMTGFNKKVNCDPYLLKRISIGGTNNSSFLARKMTRLNRTAV
ncbi:MAG: polysaccharide deacetylase family protein [Bacteroidetes bacterium]|nr:polysaccharide deacetylase family protein [Bacteroidota bacterium]